MKDMKTVIDLFERSCEKFPDNPYLWEKKNGKFAATSYMEVKREVLNFAGALCQLGMDREDRIALLSEGCNAWVYSELGMLYAGGVNVPLSIKLTDNEIVFRVEHSQARFLIVSANFLNRVRGIEGRIGGVEKIIVIHSDINEGKYVSFELLQREGEIWRGEHKELLNDRIRAVTEDDLVNISYTSGTTAEPKGIMLSHRNYVTNVLQSDSLIQIPAYYRILLFLPWDHSFAHTVGLYSFMYNGASLVSVDYGRSGMEYLRNIPENLQEVKPHILLSVPALAKNFRKNIEAGIKAKGRFTDRFYHLGLKIAYTYNGFGDDRGRGWKVLLKPWVKLWDALLFSKLRKQVFGGNLRFFVGGGALLDIELQRYYAALGIPMFQGYGLSEASPVISSNTPGRYRFGSSGILVKPIDLKVCDEEGQELPQGQKGELWIKGGNVMAGYWRNEKSTAETIVDGWLHTGDLGYLHPDGWLYVLGRFKSLLIANDGEKYSPEGIEETIAEQSKYIDYCILYNNQSPYTAGLIVPNKMALREYIEKQDVESDSMDAYRVMLKKIQSELMAYRVGGKHAHLFPERWLPAVVAVLPEALNEQNGMINSTMKVVRAKVYDRFKEEIDYLYTPEGKEITNKRNLQNLKQLIS
ncbi:AMP-binding protein [Butyricimonas virosa]|jgi:long-chain acyl-CoA synthetase|uniref:AMP-binding protein n=3 Tax=Butyricimonas virosa TaxID=544645 RepID=A0ABX7HAY3_9BACT|nr:AMP-binding protein [Butyricimonas virosa]MCI7293601.1 AMP-binding protein [Butyricimonas virosa]MDY5490433.1 AMP-binding protein [Butyricimonas virosa]MDY6219413.1 AMP-binding protein [Butyricimonas virosa]QRO52104.1 AMP-binding protein [Butyricimonas virosa]UWO49459.1 AMP-binding protein [Butyricimonas virosa]